MYLLRTTVQPNPKQPYPSHCGSLNLSQLNITVLQSDLSEDCVDECLHLASGVQVEGRGHMEPVQDHGVLLQGVRLR